MQFNGMWILALVASSMIVHCSSNRLHEYQFKRKSASAIMAAPPRAQIFTESFFDTGGDPISTVIHIGTRIAKEVETYEAQKRLDSAMQQVDIPEQIRRRSLERFGDYFDFRTIGSSKDADFLFMMKITKYGIEADSWNASVRFKIDVKIRLIDNIKNREVWKKSIHERMPISGSIFGLGDAVGNVMTASALSNLTEEGMVTGFSHLAEYTADRIAEKIQEDFIKAHTDQ